MDETTDETNVVTLYEFLRIKIGVGVIFGQGVKGAVMDLGGWLRSLWLGQYEAAFRHVSAAGAQRWSR